MDWMYKDVTKGVDHEEYLLGKPVDKNFEFASQNSSALSKNLYEPSTSGTTQIDLIRKIKEDPLYAIKRREMEMRDQLLKNPVKLKKLQEMIEKKKEDKGDKRKEKKKLDSKDFKNMDVKQLDKLLISKFVSLKKSCNLNLFDLIKNVDSSGSESGKKSKKKSKKSDKKLDRLDKKNESFCENSADKEKMHVKSYHSNKSKRERYLPERNAPAKKHDKKSSKYEEINISNHMRESSEHVSKYDTRDYENERKWKNKAHVEKHKTHDSTESRSKNKMDKEYPRTNNRSNSSSHGSELRMHEIEKKSKNGESVDEKNKHSSQEKFCLQSSRKQIQNRRSADSDDDDHRSTFKDSKKQCKKMLRSSSNVSSSDSDNARKLSRKKFSKNSRSHISRNETEKCSRKEEKFASKSSHHRSRSSSDSSSQEFKKQRIKSDEKSHKRSNETSSRKIKETESHSLSNSKKKMTDKNHDFKPGSKDNWLSKSKNPSNKKRKIRSSPSSSSSSSESPSKSKSSKAKAKRREKSSDSSNSSSTSSSSPSTSNSSSSSSSSSDSDSSPDHAPSKKIRKTDFVQKGTKSNEKSQNYGLSIPAGAQVKHKSAPVKTNSSKIASKSLEEKKPPRKVHLTEEEKDRKMQEMLDNAKWRENERKNNISRFKREDEKEKEMSKKYDEGFMRNQLIHASSQLSVSERVKSNINNIQRSKHAMDKNFTKR